MWAIITVLENHENIRQREFVKAISRITSVVLTQQPVLHKICAMYPSCSISWLVTCQSRSPLNNPPFNLYWALAVAQQQPQTLSRCLADAEMLHCTSALQTFSTPIRPFDRLCLLLSLLMRSVDGCGLSLHTSGSFPFLTRADHLNFFTIVVRWMSTIKSADVTSGCLALSTGYVHT